MARRSDRRARAKRERSAYAVPPSTQLFEAPAGAEESEYPVALMCGCRITQRFLHFNHTLVFFAVVWSERTAFGRFIERYSVDTGHGHYHEHTSGHQRPNDRRDLRPLLSQVDVQECFDDGYDRVQDRHDHFCRGGSR